MAEGPIKVFCSYSHNDESLRNELETHLAILSRKKIITIWHDRKIGAGDDWENNIDENLNQADIVLLLISPDFIASDYCYGKEMNLALEKHEANQAKVIPLIIRPVDWKDAPFSKLQALPEDGKPVTSWLNRDEAWLDITKGLRQAVKDIQKQRERSSTGPGLISLRGLLAQEFKRIEAIYEGNKICSGAQTGFDDLDRTIDGIHPSDFAVIAGRPSMGRTDLLVNLAVNFVVHKKQPVAFFSIKLPADQIIRRLTSLTSRVPSHRLVRGYLKDQDWPQLTSAVGLLIELPIFIDDSSPKSFSEIAEESLKLKSEKNLGLILIDSIQHLTEARTSTSEASLTVIGRDLKSFAKEAKIPIVAVSSLSRSVETRSNKRPFVRDFGEWSGLQEEADIILFLYRDEIYNLAEDNPNRGLAEIIVGKNIYGPMRTVLLAYMQDRSLFANLAKYEGDAQPDA